MAGCIYGERVLPFFELYYGANTGVVAGLYLRYYGVYTGVIMEYTSE